MCGSFATRSSRAAASRTCATVPGADARSALQSVCTESTTETVGTLGGDRRADGVEARLRHHADASDGADARGAQPHLRGRLLAATMSTFARPASRATARASSASTCRCRARRRAGSASRGRDRRRARGRARRCPCAGDSACSSGTWASGHDPAREPGRCGAPRRARLRRASSASVDQASQPGHWPSQRGSLRPHSLQTKTVLGGRAMDAPALRGHPDGVLAHVGSPSGRAGRRRARLSVVRREWLRRGTGAGARRRPARTPPRSRTTAAHRRNRRPRDRADRRRRPRSAGPHPRGRWCGIRVHASCTPLYDRNRRLVGAV